MPGAIFVSYRRATTSNAAGRLADRLMDRFGEDQVFVDVDAIDPGADWVDVVEKAVAACRVLLVVIGPTWHTATDEAGRRRIEDPHDPVAVEVRAALATPGIGVIPVLVDGAQMPRADDLPPDLQRLARINAARLEYATFRRDATRLMEVLERLLAAPLPTPPGEAASRPTFSRRTPGCIVFLVDRSQSMSHQWSDSGLTLAEGAAGAVNKTLRDLCVDSVTEQGAPLGIYFYIGIYGYGLRPSTGREGVESALPGALAQRAIVPLPELAEHPLAIREERSIDAVARPSRSPVWIEPEAGFRTPMCAAFATAGAHIHEWSEAFPDSFPPIVVNITDGLVTDSPYQGADLATWAARLATVSTRVGSALLFNAFLSPGRAPITRFPSSATGLPIPGPELFAISSRLPEPILRNARAAHVDVEPGSRGFVFNADLATLTTFLQIGTRFAMPKD